MDMKMNGDRNRQAVVKSPHSRSPEALMKGFRLALGARRIPRDGRRQSAKWAVTVLRIFLVVVIVEFAGAEGDSERPAPFDNFSIDDYGPVTLLQRSDAVDSSWSGMQNLLLHRFGIEVDAAFLPSSDFNDKFNILVSAGDIPDMVAGFRSVPIRQFNDWGAAGILYPVDELMDHAPALSTFYEEFPYIKEFAIASDGHLYHVPGGYDAPAYYGTVVRRDLLDEFGFDPDQVDDFADFRDMLRTLQDASNGAPVLGTLRGFPDLLELPFRAFGMDSARGLSFDDESREFYYPFASDEAYYVVDWLRELYADGIIDPEVFSNQVLSTADYFNRYPALLYGSVPLAYHYEQQAQLNGYPIDLEAVQPPSIQGTQSAWRTPRVVTHPEVVLDRQLVDGKAQAIMAMLDWLRTDEGYASSLYGVRGEDWDFVDGVPRQTNPFTTGAAGLQVPNTGSFAVGLSRKLWELRNPWVDKQMQEDYLSKYLQLFDRTVYPELLFTLEDARAVQPLLRELEQLVFQWYGAMIVGATPMSDWPLFLDELRRLGLDLLEQQYNQTPYRETPYRETPYRETPYRESDYFASGGRVTAMGVNTSSKSSNAQSGAAKTGTKDRIDWANGALPKPTSLMVIDTRKLLPFGKDSIELFEADVRLRSMLNKAGYRERGYYSIPKGFLLVTSLDVYNCNTLRRTRDMGVFSEVVDAAKKKLAEVYGDLTAQAQDRELFTRLLEAVAVEHNLGIEECVRLLMFAIENGKLNLQSESLTELELYNVLDEALSSGTPYMPPKMEKETYPQPKDVDQPRFKVTFLAYQFEKSQQPSRIRFVDAQSENKPCAYKHLIGAGLGRLVTRNQRWSTTGC